MTSVDIEGPKPRTAAALAARRRGTQAALDRVTDAITRLRREKTQVSVAAVARRAAVSRTFLYSNPDAKAAIDAAARQEPQRDKGSAGRRDEQHGASWRERALNAEDGLKAATVEILTQRGRIGELLGRIRDLESHWTKDEIQRVSTENTTLKQRVQQLTAESRTLEERLQAARSNLRFQDRRIADLEAQLAAPEHIATGQ
jgi:chromosome segregation ATPase